MTFYVVFNSSFICKRFSAHIVVLFYWNIWIRKSKGVSFRVETAHRHSRIVKFAVINEMRTRYYLGVNRKPGTGYFIKEYEVMWILFYYGSAGISIQHHCFYTPSVGKRKNTVNGYVDSLGACSFFLFLSPFFFAVSYFCFLSRMRPKMATTPLPSQRCSGRPAPGLMNESWDPLGSSVGRASIVFPPQSASRVSTSRHSSGI